MSDDLSLKIIGIEDRGEADGAQHLALRTTRGPIPMRFHPAAEPARAALCVSGASGGVDGPLKIYPRLGAELPAQGIAIARLDYRAPNEFGECVLHTVAGPSFLPATHYQSAAL